MKTTLVTIGILAVSFAAFAQEAAEKTEEKAEPTKVDDSKVKMAKADVDLESVAAAMNDACGTKLKGTIDWASFEKTDWKKYSLGGSFCGSPLKVLKKLCEGPKSKKYIKKAVKSFKCVYGGKDKRDLKIKKGALTTTVDFEAPNLDDFNKRALIKSL